MTAAPDEPDGLFAAKGQAMPACSEPLVKRSIPAPSQDRDPGPNGSPRNGQDAPQDASKDESPASVLSIDLRRVLVPAAQENTVRPELSVAPAQAAPAQPNGHPVAGPLVAAMVAIAMAGGGVFLLNSDRFSVTRVADESAAADTPTTPAEETDVATEAAAEHETEAAERLETGSPAAQKPADSEPQGGSLPSFDLVRVEPDGSAVIAGRATPYAELVLLHNGEPIGTVKADWFGEWAFVTARPLPADRHEITLLVNEPDAEITLPQGAEAPARVSGLGNTRPR